MSFKNIFKNIVLWRLALILVALVAIPLIPLRLGYTLQTVDFSWSNLVQMWASFDCRHYLSLAEHGYSYFYTQQLYAFFPVFPFLIRSLASITGCYLTSGLIISHLSLIFALYFLYKLVRLDFKEKTAKSVLLLLLLFPTSFLFGAINSESTYLLFVVLSFYLIRQKKVLPAVLIAILASATKFSGIFIWPALIIEFWHQNKKSFKKMLKQSKTLLLLFPPLGLILFMRFQAINAGNPLAFIETRPDFAPRFAEKITLIYQVFFRYLKMIFTLTPVDPIYFTVLLEAFVGALFLILIILAFKKVRSSYALFALLSYLTPTLTGSFSSMPRFALSIFPAFIVLALLLEKTKKKGLRKAYIIISIILSIVSIALYTRGYFIA